jgi:4-hydroxybenzoate polyprenyltransferase
MSAFYVGGMFLNDAFDRAIDARERPERPIPSGRIGAGEVFAVGFGLLGAGVALAFFIGGARAAWPAIALAATIVLYDAWHKGNVLGPAIMAACRVLVYVTAGFATTHEVRIELWIGAAVLFLYLVGLTYAAKQKRVTARVVAALIAGISLVDAAAIARWGRPSLALTAAGGFALTLFLQRWVKGT